MRYDLPLLVTFVVQITLVAGVALLVASFLRRNPAARHAVLACALFVIAAGPAWNWLGKSSGLQRLPTPNIGLARIVPVSVDAREPETSIGRGRLPVERRVDWTDALMLTWMSGVVCLLLRQILCWHRVWRETRGASECPQISHRNVRICDSIDGPISFGLFSPVILVPCELVRLLSRCQLDQVIEHEQAHASRGDHLVATVQRIVAIVFWPHPLIHLLNRALDRAREESCDNAVLARHGAADYARTLLQIGQWMSDRTAAPSNAAALALLGRPWNLARRIEELLDERRNPMTRARLPFTLISLLALGSTAVLVSCAGAQKDKTSVGSTPVSSLHEPATTQPGDLRPIAYTIGDRDFFNGDDVQIKQVRCTADKFTPGEMIEVTGTYDLHTAPQANLHLYLTASANEPHAPELVDQGMNVKRGHGEFRFRETLSCVGWPHVTFYSNKSGKAFGGVYFGDGEWLLAKRGWESSQKNAAEVAAE